MTKSRTTKDYNSLRGKLNLRVAAPKNIGIAYEHRLIALYYFNLAFLIKKGI